MTWLKKKVVIYIGSCEESVIWSWERWCDAYRRNSRMIIRVMTPEIRCVKAYTKLEGRSGTLSLREH